MSEEEWTSAERTALSALARPEEAGHLEEATVVRLRAAGGLRLRRPLARWAAVAAMVVLAFLAGRRFPAAGPAAPAPTGPRFLLLLYDEGTPLDARHEAERVEEYRRWAVGLARQGKLEAGEKLGDRALLLGPAAATRPAAVAGYFVLKAASFDEATQLARGCPHLEHGGRVELRPIDPT